MNLPGGEPLSPVRLDLERDPSIGACVGVAAGAPAQVWGYVPPDKPHHAEAAPLPYVHLLVAQQFR